jgi:2-polyprenyl-3-methyl-5-hydroxy-6-metoxy-1,4-benzoquinol methylase
VSHLNDPDVVREQYASEQALRARASLWADIEGPNPKDVLFDAIAACSPRRVLEVGGGEGWLSDRVAKDLGAEVTMVDQSERMVELACERGVDARVGDVQALPFADASFDLVIAAWMLYHVTDLDLGLSEIARVLEPGGQLVANTNSKDHCGELFSLIGYPADARAQLFNAENGEASLRRHFADVARADVLAWVTVRERQTLVDYRASLMTPTDPVPVGVELPLRIGSRGVVFTATK